MFPCFKFFFWTIRRKEAKDFLKLMAINFSTKLARVLLSERRFGVRKPLPLPSDIKQLAEYISAELKAIDLKDCSYKNFAAAVRLVET